MAQYNYFWNKNIPNFISAYYVVYDLVKIVWSFIDEMVCVLITIGYRKIQMQN